MDIRDQGRVPDPLRPLLIDELRAGMNLTDVDLPCFVCPGIALRSVNHGLHGVSVAAFYGLIVLGLFFGALYRKLTPNM